MTTGRTSRTVSLAAVQFARELGDKATNLARATALVREAAAAGAQIVGLPELFSTGYFPRGATVDYSYLDLAEPVNGPTVSSLVALTQELDVSVIAPFFEFDPVPKLYYNSTVVIRPEGAGSVYRKRHLASYESVHERAYFTPGDIPYHVTTVAGVRVGVLICYDRHFPESFRSLTMQGAEVVFCVNNTYSPRSRRMWFMEQAVNASTNGIYLVSTNVCGETYDQPWFGLSSITDPLGETVGHLDEERGVLVREVDLGLIETARRHYASIKDTRISDFEHLASVKR